ncbi:PIG-L family deacetylase [Salana multivorans]
MSTQQPDPRTEPAEPAGPTTPDALVPGPLLAVYAHPDDETLQAGALLALAAVRGRRVVVVTATRGERGEMIGMPEVEGTAEVREIRAREIRDALAALGVHEHHFLDEPSIRATTTAPVRRLVPAGRTRAWPGSRPESPDRPSTPRRAPSPWATSTHRPARSPASSAHCSPRS